MTTSNFDGIPSLGTATDTVNLANSLPDVSQLEKLANELFLALPCDGTGTGVGLLSSAASKAASNVFNEQLSGIDKALIPGTSPNHFGVPGEAELQKLFAPRSASVGSFPSSKLATSHPDDALSALHAPQQPVDKSLFTGINTQGFDLPGEAELK